MEIGVWRVAYSLDTPRAFIYYHACMCSEVTLNFKCAKIGREAQAGEGCSAAFSGAARMHHLLSEMKQSRSVL